jgi:Family of unknown function (DUF6011)
MRNIRWRFVTHEEQRLYKVGVRQDGSLDNPNGYPEDLVRAAIQSAEARWREYRSQAATKAAATRRRRTEQKVYSVSQAIIDGHVYGPRQHCVICRKGLDDPDSIERGIGSDCWQRVLLCIEIRVQKARDAEPKMGRDAAALAPPECAGELVPPADPRSA